MKRALFYIVALSLWFTSQACLAQSRVYIININGPIDNEMAKTVERGVDRALEQKAEGLIFHIDTYGGLLEAANDIRKDILEVPIPTAAFIDKDAASGGAMIALACDSVYMSSGASMGAATVVDGSGKKASEKMQSYMRSLMRSTAEARGRNPRLAEAMVEENLSVDNIVSAGQLLSLSTDEAIRTHMANGQANSLEQVAFKMDWGSARLIHEDSRWQEVLLTYLASPVVSALLMLLMLGGLFFELHSPGLGIPGLIAATSALLFFAPLYVLGLAQGWEIILFFVGVLLIILEIFVIPGFGITGISGIILVVLSLGAALVGNIGLDFPSLSNLSTAIWTMLVTLLLSVLMIVSLARYLPGTSRFSRLILKDWSGDEKGYIATSSTDNLLGMEGEALTALRPSGTVIVNGNRVDVVSDGEFIHKGEKIRIKEVTGNKVVAARVNRENPAEQPPKEDKIDS